MADNVNLTEQKADLAHHDINKEFVSSNKNSKRGHDALVAQLRAGDRAAAAEVVDLYYKQIYLFMRRLGHDRHTSEDLTQESFLNAWYHIYQLKDGKALNSWIYRIAANVSKLYWRRHKGRNTSVVEGMDFPDKGDAQYEKVQRSEQLEQLNLAVARLPIKLKQTIVLHYLQQLTITESAEAAGIREGTFKSRLNRALTTLRKRIV